MLDVAKEIIDEDGIGGLWNGIKFCRSFQPFSFPERFAGAKAFTFPILFVSYSTQPGLVLTVNPAITYGAFERYFDHFSPAYLFPSSGLRFDHILSIFLLN
jgi:hypothetical protein